MDEFAIHRAAERGNVKALQSIIEQGVCVDSRDADHRTPLHWAAEQGRYKVAELLISNHCNVNLKDRYGRTPVMLAAHMYKKNVVHLLLKSGAQVNCADKTRWTLLHMASRIGNDWVNVVQRIMETGEADVNAADVDGKTPLMLAAKWKLEDVAALLLRSGADIKRSDATKRTALHSASGSGCAKVVQLLLEEERLDLNLQARDGNTPLHDALSWGYHSEVVKQLLTAGADVNIQNNDGDTPLMLAAGRGQKDVAALLLRSGADVHRGNKINLKALHKASWHGHTKVVQLFLEEEGLDLNPQDWRGNTPLHVAFSWGYYPKVVKQLLTAGADANIKNIDGETALGAGIKRRRRDKSTKDIKLFLQHGFFFDDCDYALLFKNPVLKDLVLKYVCLCTQSILNRFHHQSLPALYNNPNFGKKLPSIENFKLNTRQMHDVENFVKCDIQTNMFCNIVKARPLVLVVLCVHSLLACQSDMKRTASPSFTDSKSPLKKTRYN